jgi:hypothetical protein
MRPKYTNDHSRFLSAGVRWGRSLPCAFILVVLLFSTTTHACEGPELEKTIQIIQSLQNDGMRIGYQCGMSVNPFECTLQAMTAINETYGPLINSLSPSCRALIESVGNAGRGGGTQCMGGVCCDSTGCYGP